MSASGRIGHLAFNDPPADFATDEPYLVVQLDEACRRQQVGEGWFASVSEVPESAISMSIRQILEAREIICVVPDARKAVPVKAALEGPITPLVPASALREHPDVTMYLDAASAALLQPETFRPTAATAARDRGVLRPLTASLDAAPVQIWLSSLRVARVFRTSARTATAATSGTRLATTRIGANE